MRRPKLYRLLNPLARHLRNHDEEIPEWFARVYYWFVNRNI